MGTRFSITGDAVNRHAGNLDGSVADMNANLQQFINALAGLPGVWRGAAFQSFSQLQQRWEQASRDLNLALADIRGRVGEAGSLYDQYHTNQQATIGRAAGAAAWTPPGSRADEREEPTMSVYSYDSAVARDAEGGLSGTIASLQGSLDELGGFVNSVCANWEGDEQGTYRGIQTKWDGAAATVREILEQIRVTLGQTTESVDTMRSRVNASLLG